MYSIKARGICLNNLRYDYDTAINAETKDHLQKIMDIVTEEIFHPSNLKEKRSSKMLKIAW